MSPFRALADILYRPATGNKKSDEKHATLHNAVSAHGSAESGCNVRATQADIIPSPGLVS